MKKLLALAVLALAVLALALLAPAAASAHPLGNFTVNHFSRIQPSGDRIYVLYVLDMAEIPTFQARGEVRAQGEEAYAAGLSSRIRANLSLAVGGRPLALRELDHALAFPPGAGGLRTTRLEIVFEAGPVPAGRQVALSYRDGNFPTRIGWKEIVIAPASGQRPRAPACRARASAASFARTPRTFSRARST